jgi:hypothetical protein
MYKDRAAEYIGGAEEVPRESQVAEELHELDSMIITCLEMVDVLGGRLDPVLRMEPAAKETAAVPVRRELVPLATSIEEMRLKMYKTTKILGSIMDRLEL